MNGIVSANSREAGNNGRRVYSDHSTGTATGYGVADGRKAIGNARHITRCRTNSSHCGRNAGPCATRSGAMQGSGDAGAYAGDACDSGWRGEHSNTFNYQAARAAYSISDGGSAGRCAIYNTG